MGEEGEAGVGFHTRLVLVAPGRSSRLGIEVLEVVEGARPGVAGVVAGLAALAVVAEQDLALPARLGS